MSDIARERWNRTAVRCLACSWANERPISLMVGETEINIIRVLETWREPDHLHFKVETEEGKVYDLRCHEYEDVWEVRQSGRASTWCCVPQAPQD